MANYILSNTKKKKLFIVDVGLSAEGKSKEKKDISITVTNGISEEDVQNFSLKLYEGTGIGLINSTAVKFIDSLTDPTGKTSDTTGPANENNPEVKKFRALILKENPNYFSDIEKERSVNRDMNKLKNIIKKGLVKTNKELGVIKAKIQKLRDIRRPLRPDIDALHAKVSYKIFTDFIKSEKNKKIFVKNLMDQIGFNENDTKILAAIMKSSEKGGKKVKFFDKLLDIHPEFDLSDIYLSKSKTQNVSIVVNNGSIIICRITYKEAKGLVGIVDFSRVQAVNPSDYSEVEITKR